MRRDDADAALAASEARIEKEAATRRALADGLTPVDAAARAVATAGHAVLFAGAARTALFDGALLTVDGTRAAEAAAILGARRVVPAHCDSWAHFSETRDDVVAAFTAAGIADRLQLD